MWCGVVAVVQAWLKQAVSNPGPGPGAGLRCTVAVYEVKLPAVQAGKTEQNRQYFIMVCYYAQPRPVFMGTVLNLIVVTTDLQISNIDDTDIIKLTTYDIN